LSFLLPVAGMRPRKPAIWCLEETEGENWTRRARVLVTGAVHSMTASPRHFRSLCEGRYPGSRVQVRRLPRLSPSGISTHPLHHSLTVAGAAQALRLSNAYLFPV